MSCRSEGVHIDDVLQVLREEGACCGVCDKGGNRLCKEAAIRTEIMLAAAEMLERLMRERDAAVEELRLWSSCIDCKHHEEVGECQACRNCKPMDGVKDGWEWRGVQED